MPWPLLWCDAPWPMLRGSLRGFAGWSWWAGAGGCRASRQRGRSPRRRQLSSRTPDYSKGYKIFCDDFSPAVALIPRAQPGPAQIDPISEQSQRFRSKPQLRCLRLRKRWVPPCARCPSNGAQASATARCWPKVSPTRRATPARVTRPAIGNPSATARATAGTAPTSTSPTTGPSACGA